MTCFAAGETSEMLRLHKKNCFHDESSLIRCWTLLALGVKGKCKKPLLGSFKHMYSMPMQAFFNVGFSILETEGSKGSTVTKGFHGDPDAFD